MEFVIVSGLSGAGKSVALRTLEDLGYSCIDNLPLFLLRDLALGLQESVANGSGSDGPGIAVGIDARNGPGHLAEVPRIIRELEARDIRVRVLFLDAANETLIRRFSETRRKHPLTDGDYSLEEAIELERGLLQPLEYVAESRLDSTHTNVHELRRLIGERLDGATAVQATVLLLSFGFKKGVPMGVDFVFDIRCLPNPHWQQELQPLTGLDAPVVQFLERSPQVLQMRDDLIHFLDRWVPCFEGDGRSYLTIAVGCTGGQHRSVFMVEALRWHLSDTGHRVLVRHRELS